MAVSSLGNQILGKALHGQISRMMAIHHVALQRLLDGGSEDLSPELATFLEEAGKSYLTLARQIADHVDSR